MPIRGVTDQPRIPRLGKIHLGDRSGKNGAPVNQPYFVVPEEVAEVYGPEPTELKIVFLSDNLDLIASQYYRAYNATSGLICKGDGENADALMDADELRKSGGELTVDCWAHGDTRGEQHPGTKTFVRQQIHCAGNGIDEPPCPMFAAKPQKCAARNFLQFAVRDVPGLGVYQLDTGSMVSTRQINGAIELAKAMFGGIAGVPCTLRRVKRDVAPDGLKKGVWMVELEVDTTYSLTTLVKLREGPISRVLLPPVDESEVYESEVYEDAGSGEGVPAAEWEDKRIAFAAEQVQRAQEAAKVAPEDNAAQEPVAQEDNAAEELTLPAARARAAAAAQEPTMPTSEAVALSDLLNAIEAQHGKPAKIEAIAVQSYLYGTAVVTRLSPEERADYADKLQVRLDDPEHAHEMAYTPRGGACCSLCGCVLTDEGDEGSGLRRGR